jgi:hypothetical protein
MEYVQGASVAGEGTNEPKDILTKIFFSQPFPPGTAFNPKPLFYGSSINPRFQRRLIPQRAV